MAEKLSVSIIIPTYNRKEDLKRCLRSVFRQNFIKDTEVIVVDDASTDGTKEMVREMFKRVKVIENEMRLGVSKSKNKGVVESRGKYLWFLDSDTEISKNNCLKFLYEYGESNLRMGSLGCELIMRGKQWMIREHQYFDADITFPRSKKNIEKPVDYLATCNCFVRSKLVKEIGGFNEKYYYGYEDAELGKKIVDLGYLNILDSRAEVFHYRSEKSRTANYKIFFKNRIRFCLWNFSFKDLVKLPYFDIKIFFEGAKKAKTILQKEIKGQSATTTTLLFGKFGLALEYFGGLFYGYLWNLFFLPKTLLIDKRKYRYV